MLTENHITDLLAQYFINRKYTVVSKLTTKQKGIDLVVKNNQGQLTYIEVKGETSANPTSARFGKYFTGDQIRTHSSVAIMQTLRLMSLSENHNVKFAIAAPKNHEKLFKKVKSALDKLGVTVYFVAEDKIDTL